MKKKEKAVFRGMTEEELIKQVSNLEKEITKGRLDGKTKQVKNVRIFQALRREIAVIKTILREKSL